MSTSAKIFVDDVDEFKCQSCGQVPICLNSTGSGHEVCDDCLPLFKADENVVCPLPACEIPSHMTNKIKIIKEDLEMSKSIHEKSLKEVLGQVETITKGFDDLSVSVSGIEDHLKNVKDKVSEDINQIKIESSKEMKMGHETIEDLQSQVEALVAKIDSLEEESKQLEEKMNVQTKEFKHLKTEHMKAFSETLDLKETLKKVKNELTEFQSSVKLNEEQLEEKMFLTNHFFPQSQLLPMNGFNLMTQYHQFQTVFTWKIKDIEEKMGRKTYKESSASFLWTGYQVTARVELELTEDENVHLSMPIEAANEKEVKLLPVVYYLLKGQKEVGQHRIRAACYDFPSKFNVQKTFDKILAPKSWFTRDVYDVDNSVTIEIYVEPPEMALEVHSRVGVLNWVVKDCEKRQSLENAGLISFQESPYFYTSPNGYKVQVQLGLDGLGKQKGPSAIIDFLQGEYDSDLTRSFPHRTTVTLFNPKDPKRRVVKTVDKDISEKSWYIVDICEAIELTDLIADDTLYVRVNIVKAN